MTRSGQSVFITQKRHHLIRPQSWLLVAFWLCSPLCAQDGAAPESRQADWPRFLGKSYDSVSETASSRIDWTAKPSLAWSIEVGDGYGIGTVADGRYFQFDAAESSQALGANERLRCFDLESGQEIWSRTQAFQYRDLLGYEDGPRSSPTIVDGHVITLGVTGQLTCRDMEDGSVIWQVDTNHKYGVVQNFFGVGSSPLVLGDRVIVMVGGSPPEDQQIAPMRLDRVSPNGSALVALDRKSGKELWRCGNDLASYSSPRPIDIDGETLVLVFARSGLMAIDPVVGKVRWQFEHHAAILESVNAMMPVVDSNHVFISECYEVGGALVRVDGKSARVVWQDPRRDRRNQSMRCHWSTPILVDGYLYGCSGRNAPDSDFRCIDFKTGEVQWSDPRRIRSSVTRVGEMLVVLEERGVVQVIKANPQRLEVVAEWNLNLREGNRPAIEYPCWAAPVVVGTKLLVRGTNRVIGLDLARR
jgi:outer membrane protein assembly factor BamB